MYAGVAKLFGIESTLPAAVLADIEEMKRLAAEGDPEAIQALAEDPLTEDESDAFIIKFFRRIFGIKAPEPEPELEGPPEEVDLALDPPRARLPFGPFLILGLLELLFAGDWLRARLIPFFWPIL